MTTHKLYLKTESNLGLLLDLLAAGLATIGPENLAVSFKQGVAVHYIGRMVQTPAELDTSVFPPVEVAPAVYYEGERANVLLSGPDADELLAIFQAAMFTHGTEIIPEPTNPQALWA